MLSQTLWWENVSQVIHLLYLYLYFYIDLSYRWTIKAVYEVHSWTVSNFLMFNYYMKSCVFMFAIISAIQQIKIHQILRRLKYSLRK